MSIKPNLITLLKKGSTINLEVTNSTNFIFTQPLSPGIGVESNFSSSLSEAQPGLKTK